MKLDHRTAAILLENIQAGHEGICYLENCIYNGELKTSDLQIFDTLIELIAVVEVSTNTSAVLNRVKEINANLTYYIDEMKSNILNDRLKQFLYNFQFHFKFLYVLLEREIAYMVEQLVNKWDFPRFYPETRAIDHEEIVARGKAAPFVVSVIVLAYNKLAYTQKCVASILTYTQDVNYELILVDNGSTDGTLEYFQSIDGAKVIHLEHNLHVMNGFNIGMMAAEGKYCAAVGNDLVVTTNWLSNLVTCLETDPAIGFVSPGSTSVSNLQQISIISNSDEDFQEKAREYNVSDPLKWEERVVVMPNVLCCPTALLEQVGYYDTRFFRGEFGDDDISFKIRRAGYKLIYCRDTVTDHYGSLTTESDHQTNSLDEGRLTFVKKYGLDAWLDARMNPIYMIIDYDNLSGVQSILGIDVKCGATLLQIKNEIWSRFGKKPEVTIYTTDPKYAVDISTISSYSATIESLERIPEEQSKVDLVFIEQPLDLYQTDLDTIFKCVSNVLNTNGSFIFFVNNSVSIERLFGLINSSHDMHNRKIYIPDRLCSQAVELGFNQIIVHKFAQQRSTTTNETIDNLARYLAGGNEQVASNLISLFQMDAAMYQMNYQR